MGNILKVVAGEHVLLPEGNLDASFAPVNYTRDASGAADAEVTSLDAHLKGVDNEIGKTPRGQWVTLQVLASAFTFDATRSNYTLAVSAETLANSVDGSLLLSSGGEILSRVTTTAAANEFSLAGTTLSIHGDITASGKTYQAHYLGVSAGGAGVGSTGVGPQVVDADLVAASNLTLSGEQTIDGVLTSASRVLCIGQTTAAQNGLYLSGAGAWSRLAELSTSAQLVSWLERGVEVHVGNAGTSYGLGGLGGLRYRLDPSTSPAVLGTDALSWTAVPGTYVLEDTTAGVGGLASIDVPNIPPIDRANIVVYATTRSETAGTAFTVNMTANGDTTDSDYQSQIDYGGAGDYNAVGDTPGTLESAGSDRPAGYFGCGHIRLIDYSNSTKAKGATVQSVNTRFTSVAGGASYVSMRGWTWESAAVINRLTFAHSDAADFAEGSRLVLAIEVP